MKINLFIWLVHQRKILTWENLLKKGFSGPSKCHLCGSHEETVEHLLNLCPFSTKVWNWVASIFRQIDRDSLSISNNLKNLRNNFSRNEIINKAWMLVPGFVIWNVWKERNKQIFKEKASEPQNIINQILKQLKDIVKSLLKSLPKDPPLPQEENIILGVADFGGAIRDHQGKTKYIFHGHLGKGTNNMAELLALEQCLEILVEANLQNAIIEADLELIIRAAKKIHNGNLPDKVSKHWKLL
eukprot:PITA_29870